MLDIRNITKVFGGLRALDDVSFSVPEKSVSALIGPNGAGKTTMMNIISGMFPPDEGSVAFNQDVISNLAPTAIARRGLSRTFQHLELFGRNDGARKCPCRTIYQKPFGFSGFRLRLPFVRTEEKKNREKSLDILASIGLADKKDEHAANLPLGEQRILEIVVHWQRNRRCFCLMSLPQDSISARRGTSAR